MMKSAPTPTKRSRFQASSSRQSGDIIGPMKYQCLSAIVVMLAPLGAQTHLPGTAPLTFKGDPGMEMVDSINAWLLRETTASASARNRLWQLDFSSREAYQCSLEPKRAGLRRILGAVDARVPVKALRFDASTAGPSLVGRGKGYQIYAVRWPVFDGVDAEGLLLEPDRRAAGPRGRHAGCRLDARRCWRDWPRRR